MASKQVSVLATVSTANIFLDDSEILCRTYSITMFVVISEINNKN